MNDAVRIIGGIDQIVTGSAVEQHLHEDAPGVEDVIATAAFRHDGRDAVEFLLEAVPFHQDMLAACRAAKVLHDERLVIVIRVDLLTQMCVWTRMEHKLTTVNMRKNGRRTGEIELIERDFGKVPLFLELEEDGFDFQKR